MESYIPRIKIPELKTICAGTLYNLSTLRAVRSDMVVKGAVRCTLRLVSSADADDQCLFLSCKALGNMCQDRSSRRRALDDGAVSVLQKAIARKDCAKKVYAACAEALAKLSIFQDLIPRLVALGGIELLITLVLSDNADAKHFCGTAFCNFLKDEPCHSIIIQKGALKPLIDLSMDEKMSNDKDLVMSLSFAIYNISCGSQSTIEPLLNGGVLPSLVNFSKQSSLAVRERVAAAICNLALSSYTKGGLTIAEIMIKEKILECITGMMDDQEEVEKMPEVTQQCVTALAIFSHDRASHEEMTRHGCIEILIGLGLMTNDLETRQVCASVLSSLTFGKVSLDRLIQKDGLKAIIRLSNTSEDKDTLTRQHCAVGLCNTSTVKLL